LRVIGVASGDQLLKSPHSAALRDPGLERANLTVTIFAGLEDGVWATVAGFAVVVGAGAFGWGVATLVEALCTDGEGGAF
jgi:hypothetical protein